MCPSLGPNDNLSDIKNLVSFEMELYSMNVE